MSLEEITAEMQRKPDAQYLIEWIDMQAAQTLAVYPTSELAIDIREAINAYYEGLNA